MPDSCFEERLPGTFFCFFPMKRTAEIPSRQIPAVPFWLPGAKPILSMLKMDALFRFCRISF